MATVGIHRVQNGWGKQHSVLVRYDDGKEVEIPQDRYESQGYEPPIDDLPWKGEGDS